MSDERDADQSVPLSDKDFEYLEKLRAEILERQEEMSRVIANVLGYKPGKLLRVYEPRLTDEAAAGSGSSSILTTRLPPLCFVTETGCGCHDYVRQRATSCQSYPDRPVYP